MVETREGGRVGGKRRGKKEKKEGKKERNKELNFVYAIFKFSGETSLFNKVVF